MAVAIYVGKFIPLDMPSVLGLAPQKVWNIIILIYCFVAAIVPVWALLQPRGHLGGYFLYASVIVAAIGVLFGGFSVNYPAFKTPISEGSAFLFPMFPMLFITVACGACSGFHALVSSGTSSKQIKRESDTKIIGYGAMLMEGVVAVIALSTVMILTKDSELLTKSPNFVYASGIGAFDVTASALYYVRRHAGRDELRRLRFADGSDEPLATLEKPYTFGLSAAPGDGSVLVGQRDVDANELLLLGDLE